MAGAFVPAPFPAFDPNDLQKLQAEVEDGSPLEEAAVSLGLVSQDDPLRERTLGDLRGVGVDDGDGIGCES